MTFEELLKSLEVEDSKIEIITTKMAENKLYVTDQENASERLNKFKEERDKAVSERDELTAKVSELETKQLENAKTSKQLEDLQKELEDAQTTNAKLTKQQKLENLLREAGATDVEYAAYKLGGIDALKTTDEGDFENWEETLTGLKEKMPKYFKSNETENQTDTGKGYQPVDTKLNNGNNDDEHDPFADKIAQYTK